MTDIGLDAFQYCNRLTSIEVDPSNECYCDIDGVLYNKRKTDIIKYPTGKSGNSYTIPDSVTNISENTFWGCKELETITIPSSVSNIGQDAFQCYGLTSINVNSENKYYSDIDGVLYNKDKTCIIIYPMRKTGSSYDIPSSVIYIADNAFWWNSKLTSITIPNSVTSIGKSAFTECIGLTSITIPNSVTSIDKYAFLGCRGLKTITLSNFITSISYGTFETCSSLTSIIIPNSVTSIGGAAFYGCTRLNSITIPNSVTSMCSNSFGFCSAMAVKCSPLEWSFFSFEFPEGSTRVDP